MDFAKEGKKYLLLRTKIYFAERISAANLNIW